MIEESPPGGAGTVHEPDGRFSDSNRWKLAGPESQRLISLSFAGHVSGRVRQTNLSTADVPTNL